MRDWGEAWINESFATYGEYLYSKHSLGEDEGALNLTTKRNVYLEEARTKYKRPIVWDRWETPNQNFDRHTYQKGAAVLHMLRWVMGDAEFKRAMSHFLKEHAYQAVDTRDLMRAISESSGQSLEWFFDQWVYQAGHPVFDVRWEWLSAEKKARLTVEQKQLPLFEAPVDVGIVTASGKRVERLRIGKKQMEVFDIACESRPLLVRFDEGSHLLMEMKFEKGVAELLYQLQNDDAMGRMWAAAELKGRGAEAELRKSAREDKFWAVRRAALESLDGDREFFRESALDPKSDVRAVAVRRLAGFKDSAFLAKRFRAEDSYVVQAEALRAIGQCGDKAQVSLLKEAAGMRSPRDVVKRAAEAALRELGGN
jgi:aminopeptidase N